MVGDLSLLASASASPVLLAPSKELHGVLPFQGKRSQQDAGRSAAVQLSPQQHLLEGAYQAQQPLQMMVPGIGQAAAAAYQTFDSTALIDVQDSRPDSVRLSLGIAEQCARQEKILKFLMSGSDVKELDASLLTELTGHQMLSGNMGSQPYTPDDKLSVYEFGLEEPLQYLAENQLIIPDDKLSIYEFGLEEPLQYLSDNQLIIPDPLLEFAQSQGALAIDENGRVIFTGSGEEMRDLLSVFLEFNVPKRESSGCKAAYLVPYFDRKRGRNSSQSNSKSASTAIEAPKSKANVKAKSPSKKKQKGKTINERDMYQNNYFHASEAFFSILLAKDRHSSTILSLKKAGPEITELLTQCSIGIAGTGLAVLLSVVCKVAIGGRTPFAATRLLHTGVGFGLFWLSHAVNGLRDTITSVFRGPVDTKLEDEVAVKIQRSMNDILLRAVTLLAITALRFA
ncbi:uncharacterized protein LOC119324403 isoform X1 [Triticum dicoccoides]|uniref:uncharacterized protein LOC119324403 isoform X1 n=1 Tax=Triticum dicoccoides TaxID=85692 RepID=UPI001890B463|nr:uncharacterized protein LOC119324403 isoform X1 [Triticum dicoccoides]